MGIVRKIKDAARWVENVAEFEAPRPGPEPVTSPPPAPEPPEDSRGARLVRGVVAFTLGAALLGAAGCRADSVPSARSTCDEPASWCGAEAVQR